MSKFFTASVSRLIRESGDSITQFILKSLNSAVPDRAARIGSGAGAQPRFLIYFDRDLIAAGCL